MNKLFNVSASSFCCTIREKKKTTIKKEKLADKNELSNSKSTDTRDTEVESPTSATELDLLND